MEKENINNTIEDDLNRRNRNWDKISALISDIDDLTSDVNGLSSNVNNLINYVGDLETLTTDEKSTIVEALNEIDASHKTHMADYTNFQSEWDSAKSRSLLNLSSYNEVKNNIPDTYIGQYNAINIVGNGDLNDVLYSGLYYVVQSGISNTPSSSNGYLLVISANAGHCVQVYTTTALSSSTLYIRKCNSGTNWGSWMTIG